MIGTTISWTEIKDIKTKFQGSFYYFDDASNYFIWIYGAGREFTTQLSKVASTDLTDWNDNYKSTANKSGTDGLPVQQNRYRTRIFEDTTDMSITNATSSTIFQATTNSITKGKLEFIMVRCENDNFDVEIISDSIQSYRLNLNDLKNDFGFKGDDNIGNGIPIVSNDGKKFKHIGIRNHDFRSELIVNVHNVGNSSKKVYSYMIGIKELI